MNPEDVLGVIVGIEIIAKGSGIRETSPHQESLWSWSLEEEKGMCGCTAPWR